jgi:hypothetical protein
MSLLLLVSGATRYPRDENVGDLIEPRHWGNPASLKLEPGRWAMDNGAFKGFDEGAFVRMLERFADCPGCLFVAAPDFVGDAASTLARWPFWSRVIRGVGFPAAFVAQDGITPDRVPWPEIGCLFIGGTTAFKVSTAARDLCGVAKARDVWVHWGRVNGKRRYELARKAGADSIDGSGFSRYPDTRIPMIDAWHGEIDKQPEFDL